MVYKYLIILVAAVLSILPVIIIKKYACDGEWHIFVLALIAQLFVNLCYLALCKTYDSSTMFTMIKFLSIILIVIIGFIFLEEKITIARIIGIIMGIVAIYLISRKN